MFKKFLQERPDLKSEYGDVLPRIRELHDEVQSYIEKEYMISSLKYGSDLLSQAHTIFKWSIEKAKKDEDREPYYQDRNIHLIRERIEIAQRHLDVETDKIVLEMFINKALNLPDGQKIEAAENIALGKIGKAREKAIKKFLYPLIEKYNLKPKSLVSFPGMIPDKWAKLEGQKETMKPDKAKEWAQEITLKIQSK